MRAAARGQQRQTAHTARAERVQAEAATRRLIRDAEAFVADERHADAHANWWHARGHAHQATAPR